MQISYFFYMVGFQPLDVNVQVTLTLLLSEAITDTFDFELRTQSQVAQVHTGDQ